MPKGKFNATGDVDLNGHHIKDWRYLADIPSGDAEIGDVLWWDGKSWIHSSIETGGGTGGVSSIFGRVGHVVAEATDYQGLDFVADNLVLEGSAAQISFGGEDNYISWNGTQFYISQILRVDAQLQVLGDLFLDFDGSSPDPHIFFGVGLPDNPSIFYSTGGDTFSVNRKWLVQEIGEFTSGGLVTVVNDAVFEGDVRGEDFYINHLGNQTTANIFWGSVVDPKAATMHFDTSGFLDVDTHFTSDSVGVRAFVFAGSIGTEGSFQLLGSGGFAGDFYIDGAALRLAFNRRVRFDDGLESDYIYEENANAGVTVDGLLVKDGAIPISGMPSDFTALAYGAFIGSPAVTVTSDGTFVTLNVEKSGGGDLQIIFSTGVYDWDCTPPDTVRLFPGSDTAPVLNYIYVLESNKTLTRSTTGWPSEEYAPIATVVCQSAVGVQSDGVYKMHAWTDHLVSDENGHLAHLNLWVREQPATYLSGVNQTLTITPASPDTVIFTTSSGVVLQLHEHIFPAFTGAPDYYTINDSVTAYNIVNDLADLLTDSTGASMSGKYFSLVLWGVVSEDTGDCKLMVNLPSGSYNLASGIESDSEKYANYSMPIEFRGCSFLISELKLRHQVAGGGNWTSIDEIDLRGLFPSLSAGGGSIASSEFEDSTFKVFNAVDNTKALVFDVSGVTAGNNRTITIPDLSGTMALTSTVITTLTAGTNIATNGTTISVIDSPTFAGTCTANQMVARDTGNVAKVNYTSSVTSTVSAFENVLHETYNAKITKTLATGGIDLGMTRAFNATVVLANTGGILSNQAVYLYRGVIDANTVNITNSPVTFEYTDPATAQQFANGFFSVTVNGGNTGSNIAAYTRAFSGGGSQTAIGYRGYAAGNVSSTGEIVGVQGFAVNSHTFGAVVSVEGLGTGATTPKGKVMAFRGSGHMLLRKGSIILSTTSADATPDDLSFDHVQTVTNTGELYVPGAAEFDGEVFVDGNISYSQTTVTANYTVAGITSVLLDGTSGSFTATLPSAVTNAGRIHVFKRIDSNLVSVYVSRSGSSLIDGATRVNLSGQYDSITVLSDGGNWHIIAQV